MNNTTSKISIRFFNDTEVRAVWDEENSNIQLVSATTQLKLTAADSTKIKTLLQNALTDKIADREMFMKGIDYSYYYEEADQ